MRKITKSLLISITSLVLIAGAATATYAVPTLQKITASDGGEEDYMGKDVAVSELTMVTGASQKDDLDYNAGSAYFYSFDTSTLTWGDEQEVHASDGDYNYHFGTSVAVDGDLAVIGALMADGETYGTGAAYVFEYSSSDGWTEATKLTASDGEYVDYFGYSVAIEDNTIVVGAPSEDDFGSMSGAAYIFTYDSVDGWTEHEKLTASDASSDARFGYSVGISGRNIVVGSKGDSTLEDDAGSAYVYRYSTTDDSWATHEQKIVASDYAEDDYFGQDVAIDGNLIVVGTNQEASLGKTSGSAYVYRLMRKSRTWVETNKLVNSDSVEADKFGASVDISRNKIIVGAKEHTLSTENEGAAYLYRLNRVSAGGTTEIKLTASDYASGDKFGYNVAIEGPIIAVGSPYDDDAASSSGSVYMFNQ